VVGVLAATIPRRRARKRTSMIWQCFKTVQTAVDYRRHVSFWIEAWINMDNWLWVYHDCGSSSMTNYIN
jgi:hypothetical protein